jgi:hypothetical protein
MLEKMMPYCNDVIILVYGIKCDASFIVIILAKFLTD